MENVENVRILIVDDKPDKAKAIRSIVEDLGETVCVHSGRDALRCLVSQSFALILLDVNMPIMDGFETAEMIRKRQTSEFTPIIFITSYYDADTHRTRAYTLGAVDYILAPVIPEILRAKVSVFVDLYKKTEEVKMRAAERMQLMQEQMARVAAEAARAAAEESERRTAFLSNASQMLATSIDYEATLERVVQLTVPNLCDCCAVDLVKEDGRLQCVAVAHSDPSRVMRGRADHYPGANDPVGTAIETGVSQLIRDIAECSPECRAALEAQAASLGVSSMKSCMIVPLQARNRTLGATLFLTAESGRMLTQRDLALAEDLGRRAAVAIDNARLYKEAQLANRMKDDFLAVVSHELRTPLTPILGWTRLLRSETMGREEWKRALEVIERNASAQAKLVEDLLDVSRIITGKLRLNIETVDVAALIRNSIDSIRPAVEARQLRLAVHLDSEKLFMLGDQERLQQILWNLLSNAVKFTPKNGTIALRAGRKDGQLTIEVKDDGKGIDVQFLPYVFDRFRQADCSTTREYGGLGIGLAIVRHLVELHGGIVQAASAGDGKGATFTVLLPVSDEHEDMKTDKKVEDIVGKTTESAVPLKAKRILIVDDEQDTCDLLSTHLSRRGAVVHEAASAAEAMQKLDKQAFDLLISDIGMAGEDGYSLMRRIRCGSGLNCGIPAIALTAFARPEDAAAAQDAGFRIHLPKPMDPNAVVSAAMSLMQDAALQPEACATKDA